MKSKSYILLMLPLFASILLNSPIFAPLVKAQEGNAYFTKIEGHPKSKIYQTSRNTWYFFVRITVYNANCTTDDSGKAWFFLKIYRGDRLWWNEYNDTTYKVWECDKGQEVQRGCAFSIPTWEGSDVYEFKTDLYWDKKDTPHFLDTTSFSVTCVEFIRCPFPFHTDFTVLSYFFGYSFATFLLVFYLLTSHAYD